MIDAGHVKGAEVIEVTEKEIYEMPGEELQLLERLLTLTPAYPNTQFAAYRSYGPFGDTLEIHIRHSTPCITMMGM